MQRILALLAHWLIGSFCNSQAVRFRRFRDKLMEMDRTDMLLNIRSESETLGFQQKIFL